jgi:hypothetical protein
MISLNLLIEKNVKNIESHWRETVSPEVVVHGPSYSRRLLLGGFFWMPSPAAGVVAASRLVAHTTPLTKLIKFTPPSHHFTEKLNTPPY